MLVRSWCKKCYLNMDDWAVGKGKISTRRIKGMKVTIARRKLSQKEITDVVVDIKQFPDLAYIKPTLLVSFSEIYVAEVDRLFAGFCAVETYKGIRKLGPIAVSSHFQKHGVGMALMMKVVEESKGKRTYFGTSNQKIREYGLSVGAVEYRNAWALPADIKRASVHLILGYLSFTYIYEMVRKFLKYGRHRYTFFVLP